jgi:dTDP-4-amino-4,6-dideoxygalactose transaminase
VRLPISRPSFDARDLAAVAEPLQAGWVVQGPQVARFEARLAEFTGAAHAVACSSGTTALHLALVAAGIGPGDEVIVPAFTWIASANAVVHAGATPRFVDITLADFNLAPAELEATRTSRTRAILPVHQFGAPANLDAVLAFARAHDLRVIEDAACGFGTMWRGTHVGTVGDAGCLSFHPRKAITTGEGGMVLTRSAHLAQRCRSLRDHGAERLDDARPAWLLPDFTDVGFNYRLTDLQAALGVSQMTRADELLASRRALADAYDELLADLTWLQRPVRPTHGTHAFQSYVCLLVDDAPSLATLPAARARRDAIMAALEARGIGTRQGTHAVPHTQAYARRLDVAPEAFPNAQLAEALSIALPLYPGMTRDDVAYVAESLRGAFPAARRVA